MAVPAREDLASALESADTFLIQEKNAWSNAMAGFAGRPGQQKESRRFLPAPMTPGRLPVDGGGDRAQLVPAVVLACSSYRMAGRYDQLCFVCPPQEAVVTITAHVEAGSPRATITALIRQEVLDRL